MKTLKVLGISIVQSLFFVMLSYIIIRTFVLISDIMPNDGAAAIGIIGGADGPTAIFFSSKAFSGDPFLLNFFVSLAIILICNLSAFVQSNVISRSILLLCNILFLLYCYLFLNYSTTILLSVMLVSIIVLVTGYILVRGTIYFNYK